MIWQALDDSDDDDEEPRGKLRLPVIIVGVAVLIIAAAAIFFIVSRSGNVNPNHLVGTWSQSPPIGTWVPRLEFREDGTGLYYQFNSHYNISRNDVPFTWEIENGNMMRNSLWHERVEVIVQSGARPPRFRYRLESDEVWQSFMMVMNP